MRRGMSALVAVWVLALLLGVAGLYRMRIARGDVFPEYSSLRADPLGLRALHDAAALLPGTEAGRWLRPLERLDAGAGDVVIVAGVDRRGAGLAKEDWLALDRVATAGARVVVAWRAEPARPGDGARAREIREAPWAEPKPEAEEKKAAGEKKKDVEETRRAGPGDKAADGEREEDRRFAEAPARFASEEERRWGFRLGRRELVTHTEDADARRGGDAPDGWPATLARWRSDLFFLPRAGDGWRVLYGRGEDPVMIGRTRGAGSLLLLADSFVLSNEAVQCERATPVLAAVLGGARRVVFVESHLGVAAESGVAVLARRYGLAGAALTALVLAALWIWRQAAPLAPVPPEEEETRLVLAPTAGLEALLRRAVAPPKLFAACLDAWRPGAGEGDRRRFEAGLPPAGTGPVEAYNAATRALSKKKLS